MTEAPNKTERKLSRTGEKQTLQGVVGETDASDIDIFGFQVIYTTGDFVVDREALLEVADELDIPDWMLPGKTMPHNAFGYAIDDLLEGRQEIQWEGQRVQFDLRQNDSRYSYTLDASVYYPPEMTNDNTGRWMQVENSDGQKGLGVIEYENPDEQDARVRFHDRVDEGMSLHPVWAAESEENPLNGGLKQRMEALFEKHKESHRGKDVNNMTYYLVDQWTDSIRLRDACYFVPANHTYSVGGEVKSIDELIDAFSALYDWVESHKRNPDSDLVEGPDHAQVTEMNVVEIMDTDRQREMVERKVDERLTGMAEDMAESVIERVQDDDTVMEEVTAEVTETMDNLSAVAGEYDDLMDGGQKRKLKTQNAVKRAVRRALGGLGEAEAELVEEVLDEADESPAPEAAA